ncbi:mRNA-capping enzyme subunit beta [Apiospora hydei]|uniref:mRNA-capping enzyme subunit beta n=1 Tax=Apiospora hydei TaxID=1337664 RepID=A0ABR1VWU6_9PEZI
MDLNSMLNKDSGAGGASRQPPPPPASLAKTPSSSMSATPHTPVQPAHPSHGFRDYGHPMHASPGPAPAASPREYAAVAAHPGFPPSAPYASPTSYNAPPPMDTLGGQPPSDPSARGYERPTVTRQRVRIEPIPIQAYTDLVHQRCERWRLQYGGYPRDPRDSYASQGGAAPVGMPTPHGSVSYPVPGQQVMPQTPPVGTPGGGNHMYMQQQQQQQQLQLQQLQQQQQQQQLQLQQHQQHQRSQSLQSASASTPTSAHGPHQPPFGTPSAYGPPGGSMGSPVATSHGPPHFDQQGHFQQQQSHPHQRQTSQPPTPLAAPLSGTPRQSVSTINQSNTNFAQPPSPYQQRTPSGAPLAAYPLHPQQQQQSPYHASPPPPQPSTIQRAVSNSSHTAPYDTISESHRRSQSQTSRSERERSISVSPKTRVPSLPSSAGEPRPSSKGGAFPGAPPEFSHPQPQLTPQQQQQKPNHNISQVSASTAVMEGVQYMQQPREATPGKRKLDDRDLRQDELEGATNRRPPPPGINGNHGTAASRTSASTSTSPLLPRRKKLRCTANNAPAWAQNYRTQPPNASRNYTLRAKAHVTSQAPAAGGLVNGNGHRSESNVKSEHVSRPTSPEATRSVGGGTSVKMEDHNAPPPPLAAEEGYTFEGQPFPLECISLVNKPIDFLVKAVGDFLFINVIKNPHLESIQRHGVQFEIEAKFGTIIDRDTDDRLEYPLHGECVLSPQARIGFRSSMSELQHRSMNEWLNGQVVATNPHNNGGRRNPHVQIHYKHRREIDKFYELHSSMIGRLPHAVQAMMSPKHALKARITTDQKTGEVLAKIVKARVGDLNLYLPQCPVDCRISINLEWEWDGPPEEIMSNQMPHREKQPDREKDRLSYKHGFFQVDLTQVKRQLAGRGPEKEHELEVELDAGILLDHGRFLESQGESKYQDIVEMLVNNVRALARRCPYPE